MSFLACSVQATTARFGGTDLPMEEVTAEIMKKQMTDQEWNKVIISIYIFSNLNILFLNMQRLFTKGL